MTVEADIIIVGGGLAGLSAANRATDLGLRPLILEQGEERSYPCNSRFSGGVLHVGMQYMRSEPSHLYNTVIEATGGEGDDKLARMVSQEADRAFTWLQEAGAKFIKSIPYLHLRMLAPPRRRTPGLEWEGRGPDVTLRRLEARMLAAGGQIVRGVRAKRLIEENGRFIGVAAEQAGKDTDFKGHAVVIADGGFQANEDLMRRFVTPKPEAIFRRNAGTGRGDGFRMAEEAGADFKGMDRFYGHLLGREVFQIPRLWPYPTLDPIAASGILVGPDGKRLMDEGLGGIYMANEVARLEDPLSTTVIFDETIWRDIGGHKRYAPSPNPHFVRVGGTVFEAPDLESLAQKLGIDADGLKATVAAYNEAVASGNTPALSPTRTAPAQLPPLPIKDAPFRAIQACAGITYTVGGIRIDPDARALRADGTPIPGLYACGASTGGLEGGPRAAYTGGLSKALITGLRAAEAISRERTNAAA